MAGFLVNAILHRIESGKTDDILYPIALLICFVILIAARETYSEA
jgi:hypothetical protein